MRCVRLEEVVQYIRGITFKPQDKVDPGTPGSVVCLTTRNIQDVLDDSSVIAVPEALVRRSDQIVLPGDILISGANSWNLVGKCCYVKHLSYKATVGGFIAAIRPKSNAQLDSRYLYWWLSSGKVQHMIRHLGRQTTNIANLPVESFLNLRMPLPSVEEQLRITTALDMADAIRSKRQQSALLFEEVPRAAFLEKFGDPRTNPKGLDRQALGSLIQLSSGRFLPASRMAVGGTFPVYGGNGINGYHDEFMFSDPVIVIGRVGVYCGAVHETKPKSWVTDNALYVAHMSDKLRSQYLTWALKIANLNQYSSQVAQPLLSGGRIAPIQILLPPVSDQEWFAQFIECWSRGGAREQHAINEATLLRGALTQKLLGI